MSGGTGNYPESVIRFGDRLLAGIGWLVLEFESLCDELRDSSLLILQRSVQSQETLSKMRELTRITATPLLDSFVSIVGISLPLDPDQTDRLNGIAGRVRKLITQRNQVIHSKWFLIDFADIENGTPDGVVTRIRSTSDGVKTETGFFTRASLDALAQEARAITMSVRELKVTLGLYPQRPDITTGFGTKPGHSTEG